MENGTTFEDAMNRLEEIVARLDGANIPLDESLELFGEGAGLVAFCDGKLKDAQLRIESLLPDSPLDGDKL